MWLCFTSPTEIELILTNFAIQLFKGCYSGGKCLLIEEIESVKPSTVEVDSTTDSSPIGIAIATINYSKQQRINHILTKFNHYIAQCSNRRWNWRVPKTVLKRKPWKSESENCWNETFGLGLGIDNFSESQGQNSCTYNKKSNVKSYSSECPEWKLP